MADLKSLIPTDTHTFEIKSPVDGKVLTKDNGKPMTVSIYGPYSDHFRKVAHEQAKKRLTKAKDSKTEVTLEEYQDFALDTLSATVVDWDIQFDKKALPFSPEKAKEIFKALPWLIEQVREEQDNLTNFFKV